MKSGLSRRLHLHLHFNSDQSGFTLLQTVLAVLIFGILAAFAAVSYRKTRQNAALREVQAAMLENVQALSRYYAEHGAFKDKKGSNSWPELPHQEAGGFCIGMQGQARGTREADAFTMKAVALDKTAEPRVLKLDQNYRFTLCESSISTCDETLFANSGRIDTDCRDWE